MFVLAVQHLHQCQFIQELAVFRTCIVALSCVAHGMVDHEACHHIQWNDSVSGDFEAEKMVVASPKSAGLRSTRSKVSSDQNLLEGSKKLVAGQKLECTQAYPWRQRLAPQQGE